MLRPAVALLLLAARPEAAAAACASGLDCSLNGRCRGGACSCDAGWRGSSCGALNLGPTADSAVGSGRIYPPAGSRTSSWGGGVVARGGKYHLYASEMAGHCGLATKAMGESVILKVLIFI
jgi:hypothetical protein